MEMLNILRLAAAAAYRQLRCANATRGDIIQARERNSDGGLAGAHIGWMAWEGMGWGWDGV